MTHILVLVVGLFISIPLLGSANTATLKHNRSNSYPSMNFSLERNEANRAFNRSGRSPLYIDTVKREANQANKDTHIEAYRDIARLLTRFCIWSAASSFLVLTCMCVIVYRNKR